ncbi:hypothetical protein MBH78_09400 [Oceanimonas sp. NS1]|nr:hypothetical protein [Oceanimonas sp. NS1]
MTEPTDQTGTTDHLEAVTQALNSGMFVHVRRMLQQMRPGTWPGCWNLHPLPAERYSGS